MGLNVPARVSQTTTTAGTGTYSLISASSDFQNFRNYFANGSTVAYVVSQDGVGFEIASGVLTYGTPDTISRYKISSSSNGNNAVNWGAGTKQIFSWRINGSELTPEEFGAKGDGVTDDSGPLVLWFAALCATKTPGRLISWYYSSISLNWDLTTVATTGIKITGNGYANCGILLANAAQLKIYSSSSTVFYPIFRDFSVHGNVSSTAVLQLGDNSNGIAINEGIFQAIEVKNANSGASAAGVGLAALYNCDIWIVSNCNGAGNGYALICNGPDATSAVAFCRIGGSFGNAQYGLNVATGFFFGNTLVGCDFEEVNYDIGGASSHIGTNSINGGTFVYNTACFNFTSWNGYQYWALTGTNIAPNTPGLPFFETGSVITAVMSGMETVITPAVPSSGVAYRNRFLQNVMVVLTTDVDNPLTTINISNPDVPSENINLSSTNTGSMTVMLRPGQQIKLTYSLNPPSWLWLSVI